MGGMCRQAAVLARARAALVVCCLAAGYVAAAAAPDRAEVLFDFDVASQPLAAALRVYARTAQRPAVFRSEMVAGKTSAALQGVYSAPAALALLLQGTGLVVETVDAGDVQALVLAPAPDAAAMAPARAALPLGDYAAVLQAGVWAAFCADTRTEPGDYRALLRFQVDGAGQVQRPRLLALSGDAARDAALLEALRQVRIGQQPPAGFPQPVTLLIEPHQAAGGPRCGEALHP